MLSDQMVSMVKIEQNRQNGRFIRGIVLDDYLKKLSEKAEVLAHSDASKCNAFVAYYCNDPLKKLAFITLVLVSQNARGTGLGRILMDSVLQIMKRRRFKSCQLEVEKDNSLALELYRSLGFFIHSERDDKYVLEVDLMSHHGA